MASCPLAAAQSAARLPILSLTFLFAPSLSSTSTTKMWPFSLAMCRGVRPPRSLVYRMVFISIMLGWYDIENRVDDRTGSMYVTQSWTT